MGTMEGGENGGVRGVVSRGRQGGSPSRSWSSDRKVTHTYIPDQGHGY